MTRLTQPAPLEHQREAPPDALPGTCWERDMTPAEIETVTEQIVLHPAQTDADGKVLSPPVYKTETRQAIVAQRKEIWFETLCRHELTPDFLASLQRALAARGTYRGPISGELDVETRRAIRRFQSAQGLDSSVLSRSAAKKLGLVAVTRPERADD